jgi:integrase
MEPLPLFAQHTDETHRLAFDRWLADQRAAGSLRQTGSIAVYRDMWGSFVAWCLGQSPAVDLDTLDARDLEAFQAARYGMKAADQSLSPRHALRLLRLIDRVLRHHAAETGEPPNTAASDWIAAHPDIRYAEAAQSDPLPDFLSVGEARRLITFLSEARPRPGLSGARRDAHRAFSWQQLRNRTAVALQLGGGLAPGDVRALTTFAPVSAGGRVRDRPWKVSVPGNGNLPPRETPIAPWAGELLQHWLQVRAEAGIVGDHLLPSTRSGKPWSKEAHYKAARAVLEEAGVEAADGGSFRLRHTFALRQLRRGTPMEQVARWLGIDPEAMGKYSRVVVGPADVI